MSIQRIPGQMLESNLTRSTDLAFQTNLLYLDVSNSRVGIRTAAPGNFALDVNGTARFQNSVEITGDLTVTGTTTVVNTTNMEIEDNILLLNSGGSVGNDAGIMIKRQTSGNNAAFYWDEGADKFKIVTTTSDGSTVTNIDDTAYTRLAGADPVDNQDFVTLQSMNSAISIATSALNMTFVGDDSTGSTINVNETLKIAGGNNISTAVSGDTVTITGNKDIDINSISSTDSSAIQINDAVNVSGALTANSSLTANTYIQMGNGSATTLAAGRLWYDETTGSWNAGMGGGNVTQQIGEELFVYGKASAAITDSPLRLVYKTGTVGASGVITFAPTIANITNSELIIGLATESIASGSFGRVTIHGVIHGITTNGTAYGETWLDNDDIYYKPSTGGLTKTIPTTGLKLLVGTVINAGSGGSGSFFVKLGSTTYLERLTDVTLTSPVSDDVLKYNGSAWVNSPGNVLGTFSFSGNKITQTASNADFEMATAGTGNFVLSSTAGLILPKGTTAQRPTGQAGAIRFNSETSKYEVCLDGSTWTALKTEATSKTVLKDVFTGDGSTQTFISANVTTAPENLIVYIDSVMQEPDLNYITDGSTSSITITDEAPHIGARIVVISGFADDLI